jgi:hypothetical protein
MEASEVRYFHTTHGNKQTKQMKELIISTNQLQNQVKIIKINVLN